MKDKPIKIGSGLSYGDCGIEDCYLADKLGETITTCPACDQDQLHIYKVQGKDCKQCWACDYMEDEK